MNYFIIEYGIIIITLVITLGAQAYINSSYQNTKKMKNKKNVTGQEVARAILDQNHLENVKVEEVRGILSDHYDPSKKVIRLSSEVYHSPSIASASVAAHECGHAIQDKKDYVFLRFRNAIIPIVNFASIAGYFAIVIGIFASSFGMIWFGIAMEVIILAFQLITLPVEFNASNRALQQLEELHLLERDELESSKQMLSAAAMTYVASVATAILQILRLILLFGHRED